MLRGLIVGGVMLLSLVVVMDGASQEKEKKITIKYVMQKAHGGKNSLLKKVLTGDADADQKKELVKLYEGMAKCKPPVGDADDWKEKTAALVKAAKADDVAALKTASNCAACHSVHKKKKAAN